MPSKRSLMAPSARPASRRNASPRSSRPGTKAYGRSGPGQAEGGVLRLEVAKVRPGLYAVCCVPSGGEACTAVIDLKAGKALSFYAHGGEPVQEQDKLRFLGGDQSVKVPQRMPKQLPPVLRNQRRNMSRSSRQASPRPKNGKRSRSRVTVILR